MNKRRIFTLAVASDFSFIVVPTARQRFRQSTTEQDKTKARQTWEGKGGGTVLSVVEVKNREEDYMLKSVLDDYPLPRTVRHIVERKAADETSLAEQERAQITLNSIGDAILSTDISGNVTYLNLVAERLTGWCKEEASGRPLMEVFHVIDGVTRELAQNPTALTIQKSKAIGLTSNRILIHRNGFELAIEDTTTPIQDRSGRMVGSVIIFRDVSQTRAMSLEMAHSAQHDFLTDLPNRMLLNDRLTKAAELAQRYRKKLAVLFVDLDHFKRINDSFGHATGDELLRLVADRLVTCVRKSDTVSRYGVDEFVVMLSEVSHSQYAARSAEKILAAITMPYRIAQHDLDITVSIGISIYPGDGHDAHTLVKSADAAMYHAKECGRNNYRFFVRDMNVQVVESQRLEGNVRHAP